MFGFQCIGYGIQNAGWNHNWMYPGPFCAPMGFGYGFGGYNPRVSDGVMLGQSILSGVNGIIAGIDAHYNKGLDGLDSAAVAIGTAAVGTNNAFLGNIIDKNTRSYTGSIMNSTMMAFTNPFAANFGLTAGAIMTSPFMNPFGMGFYGPVGMPFDWHHGHNHHCCGHHFHHYC